MGEGLRVEGGLQPLQVHRTGGEVVAEPDGHEPGPVTVAPDVLPQEEWVDDLVTVREDDQFAFRHPDSGVPRRRTAGFLSARKMEKAHRILEGECVYHVRCAVGRPVVDQDYLEFVGRVEALVVQRDQTWS